MGSTMTIMRAYIMLYGLSLGSRGIGILGNWEIRNGKWEMGIRVFGYSENRTMLMAMANPEWLCCQPGIIAADFRV